MAAPAATVRTITAVRVVRMGSRVRMMIGDAARSEQGGWVAACVPSVVFAGLICVTVAVGLADVSYRSGRARTNPGRTVTPLWCIRAAA